MLRALQALGTAVAFAAVATGAQGQSALPNRLTISSIFVSNGQANVDASLKTWNSLLATQLTNIVTDSRYNLGNARLFHVDSPRFETAMPDQATLQRRWEQMAAIQVIAGTGVQSGGITVFDGGVYLGRLAGDLPRPMVPLRQPIRAESYKVTRDAVALSALYALAVDAGPARNVACPLLAQANLIRRDLVASHTDVTDLAKAIDRRLQTLKCQLAR